MAFPIPPHLPRKQNVQDVSSKILFKFDAATRQSLNASLAASWIAELDETILETKVPIIASIFMSILVFEYVL
jgi:centromere/kinetochore protein ZW10